MLRFHQLPDVGRLPRDELPAAVAGRRRLGSTGVLSGVLHTLGYFSTEVCLGTPAKRYDLIVDTGSSITAVPCASCRACGTHQCGVRGRFDTRRSTTFSPVACRASGLACESCTAPQQCTYSVHYTEGSAIKGYVVSDIAHFQRVGLTAATDEHTPVRVHFGCQTLETGMFFKQQADGILGLQPPRSRVRVPSMLSSLHAQERARGAADSFSLCLADTTGLFLLGGGAPEAGRSPGGASVLTVPMEKGARARYSLRLRAVHASGAGRANATFSALRLSEASLAPTIVDSGTTFVYASTPVFRALHAHIKLQVPELERVGNKVCAAFTPERLDSMPSLRLAFSQAAEPLLIRPRQYMVEFPRHGRAAAGYGQRHHCVAIFDNRNGGTVIGASIMRHREVVFDLQRSTISFSDADCTRMTPRASRLRNAYHFAGCNDTASRTAQSAVSRITSLFRAG